MDDDSEKKKAKEKKKCAIKRLLKLIDYRDCQYNNKIILKLQQRFKNIMYILNKTIRLH